MHEHSCLLYSNMFVLMDRKRITFRMNFRNCIYFAKLFQTHLFNESFFFSFLFKISFPHFRRKMEHLRFMRSKSVDNNVPAVHFHHQRHMTNLPFESFVILCHCVSFQLVQVAFKFQTYEMLPHLWDLFFHCDLCFMKCWIFFRSFEIWSMNAFNFFKYLCCVNLCQFP